MKAEFRLVGLNRAFRATLEFIHTDREVFWAKIDMPKDKFDAMYKYCKGNWGDTKIAEVECDYLTEEGIPINAVVRGFREI